MSKKIDDNCIANGYAKCKCIKEKIDTVFELNAKERMNLGISSTPEEINQAKQNEIKRLKSVRKYDPDKVDKLLKNTL